MAMLETTLFPLIWLMDQIMRGVAAVTGSWGLAIVTLSLLVRIPMTPLIRWADRLVSAEHQKQQDMAPELRNAKAKFSGREQFEAIESIYEKFGYHPIQALKLSLPLAVQIPFLLSALVLLIDHRSLINTHFLFIDPLTKPDALLPLGEGFYINLLPVVLTFFALLESYVRPGTSAGVQMQFAVIAVVIALLIYSLPAAVCLYWTASNLWSLLTTLVHKYSRPTSQLSG